MASIYMDEYKGFLYDVPNVDFIRCDGTPYHYDKVSTSDANFTAESTPINGGWGKLPIGFIETATTQEVTLASAEFGLDMFEMANAVNKAVGDLRERPVHGWGWRYRDPAFRGSGWQREDSRP